ERSGCFASGAAAESKDRGTVSHRRERMEAFSRFRLCGENSLQWHCWLQTNAGSFDCVVARFAGDNFAQDDRVGESGERGHECPLFHLTGSIATINKLNS